MTERLGEHFNHEASEARWYAYWEEKGFFKSTFKQGRDYYCIVIPPPNVTGVLHLGHALNNTLQDILIRYSRMQGKNTLWQPGTDHAGIATQFMVDRRLREQGISREELGREKFIEKVWEWRVDHGGQIINQLKRLGSSCDWPRERFTMDEGLSRAVREVFVRLYHEGLIYRGEYMVNWCPSCGTALSNLEVELSETDEAGSLWYIRYPLQDGRGHLVVATTRPETMLGDTAVAVHPADERYQKFIGKMVHLPCTNRDIPVIADPYVDKEFGTGALKITPGHDFNDYEIGKKFGQPVITVIDTAGRMTGGVGKYEGLERYECRAQIVKDLTADGLLEKIEPYPVRPGRCYRCKTVVEPVVSTQWFVKSKPLADPALEAVLTGRSVIIPDAERKKYIHWMENIKDWCISRQIWWGHQIPAWYCDNCDEITVSLEDATQCSKCDSKNIRRDPDVLDTWFSSALWPFSTLGWPDKTEHLKHYYPNTAMITGFDILYFWVARMMMMGIKFMGDVPFTGIYLHGLVRDETGEKFSKTKGNVIDPLIMVDKYGADALRFTLTAYTLTGRDIRLSEKRIEDNQRFINKIWNAARFSMSHLTDFNPEEKFDAEFSEADLWIKSRLQQTVSTVRDYLDQYKFSEAAMQIYHFIWDELCDWYLEWSKPLLYKSENPAARMGTKGTIYEVLEATMRLLHPIMPFVTEEIWKSMPGTGETVMLAQYPETDQEKINPEIEKKMALIQEVVNAIRNLRGENLVPIAARADVTLIADSREIADQLSALQEYITSPPQVRVKTLTISSNVQRDQAAVSTRCSGVEVCLHVAGLVNYTEEENRLKKEIGKIEQEMKKLQAKLTNQSFLAKAPAEVVEKQKEIEQELKNKLATLTENLGRLEKLK